MIGCVLQIQDRNVRIFTGKIRVYGSLSGLVSIDAAGSIFGCNETFVSMMFGQSAVCCRAIYSIFDVML